MVRLHSRAPSFRNTYSQQHPSGGFFLGLFLAPKVLTSAGDAAVQAVRVLPVAQAVDEGSQLTHVVHFAGHHHLLVDDVGLRQVRALLQEHRNNNSSLTGECFPTHG